MPYPQAVLLSGRTDPVKSAYGVGYADLRRLTERRQSRNSQLSGAKTTPAKMVSNPGRETLPRSRRLPLHSNEVLQLLYREPLLGSMDHPVAV